MTAAQAASSPAAGVGSSGVSPAPHAAVPAIALRGIVKRFGATSVIQGIDLDIPVGERHALIGPNGAGKSTLFNLISGLLRPTRGQIRLNGWRSDRHAPERISRHGLARSFQITSLFSRMTVFEVLRLGVFARRGIRFAAWRGASSYAAVTEEVEGLLDALHLRHRTNSLSGELPYSEQRALELGLALATRPSIVLLDEPTAGMSQEEASRMVELIRTLTDGRTLLVVEHDMDVVFSLCSRISVLAQGYVIASDEPEAIASSQAVRTPILAGRGTDAADAAEPAGALRQEPCAARH